MESGNYKLVQNKTNLKNYNKFITNNLATKGIIIQYKSSVGPEGYFTIRGTITYNHVSLAAIKMSNDLQKKSPERSFEELAIWCETKINTKYSDVHRKPGTYMVIGTHLFTCTSIPALTRREPKQQTEVEKKCMNPSTKDGLQNKYEKKMVIQLHFQWKHPNSFGIYNADISTHLENSLQWRNMVAALHVNYRVNGVCHQLLLIIRNTNSKIISNA